jgi:hypothetical protein
VTLAVWTWTLWLLTGASLFACDGTLQFSDGTATQDVSTSNQDAGSADVEARARDASAVDVELADALSEDANLSDRAPGFAPPCFKNADCPVDKLHCDLASHACVECIADSNCSVPPYFRCLLDVHRCVECLTEQDCDPSSICHPGTHICLRSCSSGAVCPPTQPQCDARGFCVECRTNADCAQTDLCDTTIGRCAFCADDRSCDPSAPYCDPYNPGRNRCKECLDPSQCPAARPYCDVHGRVCTAFP